MALFDQRGQHVNTQYNAQQMNFGEVQSKEDLFEALGKLKEEIAAAKKTGALTKKDANALDYHITEVKDEAEENTPDKKSMLDHLNTAKALIAGATSATGLVTTLVEAIEAIHKLFP